MPHRIIRELFGKDLTLPVSVINTVYKQDINPDYFYERMNDNELEWYEYPLAIILLPFYPIYYILTSSKGRFLDTLSSSIQRYFQYSPPKKKSKLLAKGSFSYQIIEQVKADYPELILIPHFHHYKEEIDVRKLKTIKILPSQDDIEKYEKAIEKLWQSYIGNFNLGE